MNIDKTNIKDKLTEKPHNISINLWIDMHLPDKDEIKVKITPGGNNDKFNEVKSYLMKAVGACSGHADYFSAKLNKDQIWGLLRYHVQEIDLYKEK